MNKAKNFRVAVITTIISATVSALSIFGLYFSGTQFLQMPGLWVIPLAVLFILYSVSCYVTVEGVAWAIEEYKAAAVKAPENVIEFKRVTRPYAQKRRA